ncbi:MAG: ABC transporter substrate-binding protein [Lachnospiraceae bacterium]|nr:ABC transporter substrate-binding protein [Lachnospiraceae bacterium]
MRKKEIIFSIILALVIAATPLFACPNMIKAANKPSINTGIEGVSAKEIRFAIQPSCAFIPLYVAREKGWVDQAMVKYDVRVRWNSFDAGPPINSSILSRESDIGVLGDVPAVFAIGLGQKNVIIATAAQAADSYAVLVPSDSTLKSAADLKGKRFATVIGTTPHNMMFKFLKSGGLTMDDITFVNITAKDVENVLVNHRADAVAIWEPSVTRFVDKGIAKILGEGSDCGLAGTNVLVADEEFVRENPRLVQEVRELYRRGAEELARGTDDETLEKIAEYMKLDKEQLNSLIPKFNYSVDIVQEDIDSLNDTIDFLYTVDQLPRRYDISEHISR